MTANEIFFRLAAISDQIDDARDIADAREGDWEEASQTAAYLETLNTDCLDSIPVDEMTAARDAVHSAAREWRAADARLQDLVDRRHALRFALARMATRASNADRALSGAEYDRLAELAERDEAQRAAVEAAY